MNPGFLLWPHHTLILRSGHPVVGGEPSVTASLFPPSPWTFQGLVRTRLLRVALDLENTFFRGRVKSSTIVGGEFNRADTHGMTNSFTLMPDGWVYACHGFANDSTVKGKDGHEVKMHSGHTFRFRPDGSRIEIL